MSICHAWPEDRLENVFIIRHARCVECKACFQTATSWLTINHPEGCPVRDLRAAQDVKTWELHVPTDEEIEAAVVRWGSKCATASAFRSGLLRMREMVRTGTGGSGGHEEAAQELKREPTLPQVAEAQTQTTEGTAVDGPEVEVSCYDRGLPRKVGDPVPVTRGEHEDLARRVEALEEMREHIHWGTQEPKP